MVPVLQGREYLFRDREKAGVFGSVDCHIFFDHADSLLAFYTKALFIAAARKPWRWKGACPSAWSQRTHCIGISRSVILLLRALNATHASRAPRGSRSSVPEFPPYLHQPARPSRNLGSRPPRHAGLARRDFAPPHPLFRRRVAAYLSILASPQKEISLAPFGNS